ncbi:phospholipase A2, partial [Pseudohyphozyma bogoriensis]
MLRATSGSRAKRAYASLRFLAPTTSSSSSSRQAPWVLGAAGAGAAGCVAVGSIRAYASNRDPLLCEERKPLRKGEVKEADEGKGGFFDIQLPSLPSLPTLTSLTDSLTSLRTTFERLHGELTHAPTSAYARIQATSTDPKVHPELEWDAKVRLGNDVSHAERAFVRARRARMVEAFSRLMGEEVDERDIPVVAVAASGGGYRAMVNTLGAIEGAKETGLWDVVMYASGVSGSCWGLSSLYSIGQGDIKQTIDHVRNRIVTPFLDPETLDLLADHKTAEYILSGTVLKEISDSADSTVVDVYGTLVSARLFVPSKSTSPLSALDLKISGQRRFLDEGEQPLPIYCAIRHEVPHLDEVVEEAKSRTVTKKQEEDKEKHLKEAMKESKYMWFEVTPYEVGCDELGAWIPTWGFGRKFENGVNVERRPELSLTIFSGIFASAFCATLYSYFKEVRPLFLTLPYFKSIENWL